MSQETMLLPRPNYGECVKQHRLVGHRKHRANKICHEQKYSLHHIYYIGKQNGESPCNSLLY